MYERTIHIDVEKSDCADECNESQTQVTSPRDLGLASPAIKRRRSVKVQKRSVECEQCECVVQYYEGDRNRTYSSSPNSFVPTGAEIWPHRIITPWPNEDCVEDEGLSTEAMSFLNAQNDYFGPGGEYIADRVEHDFDLRWDYNRARNLCIAHLDPEKMNLMDLYFACCRSSRLISFWSRFESLEKPSQVACDLGAQEVVSFPQFYLYWLPGLAGPHVQLQTGSLTGGEIPKGVIWPRRWWKEALRRQNALMELRRIYGIDSLNLLQDLIQRIKGHLLNILTVKNIETMDEVVKSKTSRHLKTVLGKIRHYSCNVEHIDESESSISKQAVDFDNQYHRPNEIARLAMRNVSDNVENPTKKLIKSYFCMHEYLCSTVGAARLHFVVDDFHYHKVAVERNLAASEEYYKNV